MIRLIELSANQVTTWIERTRAGEARHATLQTGAHCELA